MNEMNSNAERRARHALLFEFGVNSFLFYRYRSISRGECIFVEPFDGTKIHQSCFSAFILAERRNADVALL